MIPRDLGQAQGHDYVLTEGPERWYDEARTANVSIGVVENGLGSGFGIEISSTGVQLRLAAA